MTHPILFENVTHEIPDCPGVYALENTISDAIYIGCSINLRSRYREWHSRRRMTVARLRRLCNPLMAKEIATAPMEGWRFVILVASPDLTKQEILRLEAKAIARAANCGRKRLNAVDGARKTIY